MSIYEAPPSTFDIISTLSLSTQLGSAGCLPEPSKMPTTEILVVGAGPAGIAAVSAMYGHKVQQTSVSVTPFPIHIRLPTCTYAITLNPPPTF